MADTAVAEAPVSTPKGTKPVWHRSRRTVHVSVFPNQKDDRTWYSISSRNRYEDAKGKWQDSNSYTYTDILVKQQLEREALAKIDELESK